MKIYINALKNFSDIKGLMNRKDYWFFVLINCMISFALTLVFSYFKSYTIPVLFIFFTLPAVTSATARRLRDTGKTPLWMMLALFFPIGTLYLVYMLSKKGGSVN